MCAFKTDGSISISTGKSNGVERCMYNKCYVMKQSGLCKERSQLLNGCCGPEKTQTNFKTGCSFYDKSLTTVWGQDVKYCTTYNAKYKMEGTADKTVSKRMKSCPPKIANICQHRSCVFSKQMAAFQSQRASLTALNVECTTNAVS